MNKRIFLTLGLTAILATGCGGGGDSFGGSGSVTPTLPASSITLDSTNATSIATSAVGTFQVVYSAVNAVDAAALPPMGTVLETIKNHAFNKNKRTGDIATGLTSSTPCDTGTITDTWTETAMSDSGSLTFNSCSFSGVLFSGSVHYGSNWNNITADYTSTANGSFTITIQPTTFTIALDYSETGNINSGYFSTTVSFSLSGGGIGFLVTTQTPLTGNYGFASNGSIIVHGANNTRLRIDFTSSSTANAYLDTGTGSFVYHGTISF